MEAVKKYPYPYFYSGSISIGATTTGNVSLKAMAGQLVYINVEVSAHNVGDTITVQRRKGNSIIQMLIEKARLRGATRSHEFDFSDAPVMTRPGRELYVEWNGADNTLTVEITLGYLLPQPVTA